MRGTCTVSAACVNSPVVPVSLTWTWKLASDVGHRWRIGSVDPLSHTYEYGGVPPVATASTSAQAPAQLKVTIFTAS